MTLSKPNNTQAEVLYEIIKNGSASIEEFSWMAGFRTRISELILDHSIPLNKEQIVGLNKHGNVKRYKRHVLPFDMVDYAKSVYDVINIKKTKNN